jgi:hypothetical protein
MAPVMWFFIISLICAPALALADDDDGVGPSELNPKIRLEAIRQRYKDFYHRQEEEDAEREQLESGIPVVKQQRLEEKKEEEKALKDFLAKRKREEVDPRLEQMHDMEVQAEKEQMEVWRKRYVQVRDHIQEVERKGLKIPEKQEYGLDEE